MRRRLKTVRGYELADVASALQKTIRRGDARLAGYFAAELFESGFTEYAWRRLLTISAEDCAGVVTTEILSLYEVWKMLDTAKRGKGRVVLAKAAILLSQAKKSRDADHIDILIYDASAVAEDVIERELAAARQFAEPIPDYAYDVHTGKGKRLGKTRRDFILAEHDALSPKGRTLFDADVEAVRAGERMVPDKPRGR